MLPSEDSLCQIANINGTIYSRCVDSYNNEPEPFWKFCIYVPPLESTLIPQEDNGNIPHLICDCGSVSFKIRFGDYETFAFCVECER